ncbi:brother of CDO-like [Orbicella faveolata]|uniref:brother of CDO-like n=1 Tax=Orbicella faveolata TaxID=48498 RepID=UPI0009E273F1|nr:brother of CDO-like [Orbicella faveolata]
MKNCHFRIKRPPRLQILLLVWGISLSVLIILFFSVVRPIVELLGPRKPLQEGDSANLTCNIIEGLPEPRLSFFKNEPDLPSKEITSPLLLTNVTDSDEGRYICEARNAGGNFTDSIYIRVKTPPELNPKLGNQSVAFNSTLNLTCIVRGDPPLQINWTRNGVDLGNRDNNTYTVSQMTFDHAGLYGCTAKNWAGKAYAFFWIDVTGKGLRELEPRLSINH